MHKGKRHVARAQVAKKRVLQQNLTKTMGITGVGMHKKCYEQTNDSVERLVQAQNRTEETDCKALTGRMDETSFEQVKDAKSENINHDSRHGLGP